MRRSVATVAIRSRWRWWRTGASPAPTTRSSVRYSAPAVVSRLECRLETGRTHQIRVHLASIGHPLVGDPTYAQRRPMLGLTRPFLHAAELAFDHPATGERVTFHSPLAADLEAWLAAATP